MNIKVKQNVVVGISIYAFAVFAGDANLETNTLSTVHEFISQETGGQIKKIPRNSKEVYYINAQSRVSGNVLEAARTKMEEFLRTPIGMKSGFFDFANPKIEGELSLYVIDDDKLPMSLIAPEGRWAFVNVARLVDGRGAKRQFLEARIRKEMARIGCMLLGGIGSTYKSNLLSFMPDAEALDKFEDEVLPVDGMMRCSTYLNSIGVKPWRMVSYRRACKEGWAPAPTNEVQQAIWDKVHAVPKAPMKIEFDPQKGR